MALYGEAEYQLRLGDFDRYYRLQPSAVLDIFQDVATVQANTSGIGRDDMMAKGAFWVVTRTKYRLLADPAVHSSVIASTWPHTPSRFSFLRDYRLTTPEGVVIAEGTSEWLLLDAETHKFVSVLDYYDGPTDFVEERTFPDKPRKITKLPSDGAPSRLIIPSYSDVDLNGHVNNARYANYVIDALCPGEAGAIGTFQIDYRQEVHEDEPLTVRYETIDDCLNIAGFDEGGAVMFACSIEVR